ncbi:MAG: inactive transglutaminase family protein [Gammaproteobacteria bacterium]|nr:inactive transglutaminase family protein [Gammaproteobacteria bacterium]
MKEKLKVYSVACLLAVVGISMALYKHFALGLPLLPNQKTAVWTLEAKVEFETSGAPVLVSLALPDTQQGIEIGNENYTTSGYGFAEIDQPDGSRRAQWTRRDVTGKQVLYYRVQVYPAVLDQDPEVHAPDTPTPPEYDSAKASSASALLDEIHAVSANTETFVAQLLRALTVEPLSQNAAFLLGEKRDPAHIAETALQLLSLAGIPNRIVRGLMLEDGRRRQKLVDLVEVWDKKGWKIFDPRNARPGLPENFIIWRRGDVSLLDVEGGHDSQVTFSILSSYRPARDLALASAVDNRAALIDFSIYSLPIEEQTAFKTILLVPIGTLVVAIFRILIGLRTSGTFMPILIALAFIQTTLLWNLLLFITVVGIGLYIRFHLARLNLLLIGRISAVVTVVIGLMSGISILSYKLGLNQILTITFFPMIILSWTIERMSILWEEEGPHEVAIQGGGSLLVATAAYLLMSNELVAHLTFNFPELLLVQLALILLIGQYTGYRLMELKRFAPLVEDR